VLQAPVLPQGGLAVQGPKQQTPLLVLQLLFWHWLFAVHGFPSATSKQLPFWQVCRDKQSPFPVQVVLHAPLAQAYARHIVATVVDGTHVPPPLQVEGVNTAVPVPLHVCPEHTKPATCFWQAPAPLQSPVLPHGCDVLVGQSPLRPPEVFGKLAQVPKLPGTLHALQGTTGVPLEGPQNAALQQTPSVQKFPVKQSLVVVQACPSRFLVPQSCVTGSQMFGARHWLSVEHAA
jgi:hypothetical protein